MKNGVGFTNVTSNVLSSNALIPTSSSEPFLR